MTQQTFVYRGVSYTKSVPQSEARPASQAVGKVYRGVGYSKAPGASKQVLEHVYRGAQFAAAC